jgi:hypothetical protein
VKREDQVSTGSPVIPLRIPRELLAEIQAAMERASHYRQGEPWTRSGFILAAIREKLQKMERSRMSGKRKRKAKENVEPKIDQHTGRDLPPGYDYVRADGSFGYNGRYPPEQEFSHDADIGEFIDERS